MNNLDNYYVSVYEKNEKRMRYKASSSWENIAKLLEVTKADILKAYNSGDTINNKYAIYITKKRNEENLKAMIYRLYDAETNEIKENLSLEQIADITGTKAENILNAYRNKRKVGKRYIVAKKSDIFTYKVYECVSNEMTIDEIKEEYGVSETDILENENKNGFADIYLERVR